MGLVMLGSTAFHPTYGKMGLITVNTFAKIKNAEFVGWVEWNATQLSMSGSTAFHPTYKKLAKVLITVEWLKNRFCQ
jgi:hypothetical protein